MRAIRNWYAGVRAHCTMTVRPSQQAVSEDGLYFGGKSFCGGRTDTHAFAGGRLSTPHGWGSNVPRPLESRGLVDERMRTYEVGS